jgi:uncharacterized protein (TIGR00255 family)
MKSMTGYGRATAALENATLTVEVNSVNRKTLDLTVSIPEAWDALEASVSEAVRRYAARGKVHVRIEVTGDSANAPVQFDEEAAAQTFSKLRAFAEGRGIQFSPTAELIWQIANAQRREAKLPEIDAAQAIVVPALETALKTFAQMRAREGEALLTDFLSRIAILQTHIHGIAARAPEVTGTYREQLLLRLRQAGLELDVSDERVLKEIALFADRCDIAEELTRLRSHLDQFTALLKSNGEIGRKAEFILQEIGREIHTIGSKANDLTIAKHVIELKNEMERIREQIANVE